MSLNKLVIDEISYQYGFEEGRKYSKLEQKLEDSIPYCKEFEDLFFNSPIDYANKSPKARQILFAIIEEERDDFPKVAKMVGCSREYVNQVIQEEATGISYDKRRKLNHKKYTTKGQKEQEDFTNDPVRKQQRISDKLNT